MKVYISLLAAGVFFFASEASAQTRDKDTSIKQEIRENAKEVGKDIKEGTEKAADKTAEIAVKGASAVTDQVYRDKVGPNGETIYVDEHAQFYWVDNKGKKVFIDKSKLKDKKK
jgi:hypothetical protein